MIRRSLMLLLCLLLSVSQVWAQFNMTFQSNVPGGLRSVWGYTDGTGREYALACAGNALKIVEVTNPLVPVVVANVPSVGVDLKEVKVKGQYAFVVNQSGALQIVDLSTLPASAATVATFSSPTVPGQHTIWIDGDYAYLGMNGAGLRDYRILNITNPLAVSEVSGSPSPLAACLFADAHDSYVVGNIAYVANLSAGITIFDITNRAAPVLLGYKTYVGGFTHSMRTTVDGQYMFTTDEQADGHLRIWDVTNPAAIEQVAAHPIPGSIIHNVFVKDTNHLFTSYYTDGVRIFDITRPTQPVIVGQYDTYAQGTGATFNGCWDVYPYFPSGTIVASDITNGLYVLTFNGTRAGYYEGVITDATSGNPLPNAVVNWTDPVSLANYSTTTGQDGSYELGIPASAVNVVVSRPGYTTSTVAQSPTAGTTTTYNIALNRITNGQLEASFTNVDPGQPLPMTLLSPDNAGPVAAVSTGATTALAQFNNIPFQASYTVYGGQWGRENVKEVVTMQFNALKSAAIALVDGYEDDFEVNRGWTVSDTASNGAWERVDPVGTFTSGLPVQPEDDAGSGSDRFCFITQQGPVNAGVGLTDVDGGPTVLTSPLMDLSGYGDAQLSYDRWFTNNRGSNPNLDPWVVQISNNDGASWVNLENTTVSNAAWTSLSFRILDFVSLTSQMRVRFIASDDCAGSVIEAGVDNFAVVDLAPPSCCVGTTGNVDATGNVDIADLTLLVDILFINNPVPPCADEANVDATGNIDIADLTFLVDVLFINTPPLPSCP